jgi:hypothetical protein
LGSRLLLVGACGEGKTNRSRVTYEACGYSGTMVFAGVTVTSKIASNFGTVESVVLAARARIVWFPGERPPTSAYWPSATVI